MDFDGDGIPDLISGSYDPGEIYLFRGEGKGKFKARETIRDKSGKPLLRKPDQEIAVESFGSWPAMVDWDGDGDLDLLFGGYDGSLNLRLNEGTRRGTAFASQIDVVDYNGDSKLDLLVGDFCTYISPRADLSKAERGKVAELRARLERLEAAVAERNKRIQEEMKKFWEPIPLKKQLTAEVQASYRKKYEEISARPENKAITDEMESVNQSLKRYLMPGGPGTIANGQDTPHGYVWLFLRK